MGRIERRSDAREDLLDIWRTVARESPPAADRLIDRIEARVARVAQFPNSGRERSELGAKLRSVPVERYIVIYRPIPDGIELARVLHGARDLGAVFGDG